MFQFNQTPLFQLHLNPLKSRNPEILKAEEQKRRLEAARRHIVAMKGAPCTGKTTVAQLLADELRFSLISVDDVRDCLQQYSVPADPTSRPKETRDEIIDDLSYETVCRIASTMLELKMNVVIDCSLSRRSHFEKLLQLSSSTGAKLVIVECKPLQVYEWKRWVEHQAESSGDKNMLKPSTLEDFPKTLLERYDEFELEDISKLVLDTTSYYDYFSLCIVLFSLFESERVYQLDFHQWKSKGSKRLVEQESPEKYKKPEEEEEEIKRMNNNEEKNMHHIGHHHEFALFEGLKGHDSNSQAMMKISCNGCCLQIISGTPAYKCKDCKFYLHKSCAESPNDVKRLLRDDLSFLKPGANQYSFPKTHSCSSNNKFSFSCWSCVFMTHLRCDLLPSVLQHGCHNHLLLFQINPFFYNYDYICNACGETGNHVSYQCRECNFHIHVNCAFLPHIASKRKYHIHDLSLTYSLPDEDSDDELYCDICETRRNPNNWLYYCQECDVTSHLECATSTF